MSDNRIDKPRLDPHLIDKQQCHNYMVRGVTSNEAEEALASCKIEFQVSCDSPH